ncbi:HNH endonuclease [Corynebacterium ciconiae DSM 44920]|uniref:HNH endonuclease signature motif containing protein n=1 Tax=Corynebacterium ciconiae TaxID=227319 RepID=UPI0003661C4D|nr:HNH endonuclease signature motif containing protein [Corynebacterium ciconiae]WKD61556.1 HNH endonuclease [Corynebacterium ciconiae DSM 44920]
MYSGDTHVLDSAALWLEEHSAGLESGDIALATVHENRDRIKSVLTALARFELELARAADTCSTTELCGSNKSTLYLTESYGWSKAKAKDLRAQGRGWYDSVVDDPATEGESSVAVTRRREEAERIRATARTLANRHGLTAEQRLTIERGLKCLRSKSAIPRETIRLRAVERAAHCSVEDLKAFVISQVNQRNDELPRDTLRAHRNRGFFIGPQDSDGGARIGGYIPPYALALLKTQLDVAQSTARPLRADSTCHRTKRQRLADALFTILGRQPTAHEPTHPLTHVVVSLSAKDLELPPRAGANALFHTTCGIQLSAVDLAFLGIDTSGHVALHDATSGRIKSLRTDKRFADVAQRIALFATELVCSHPGCNQPVTACHVHHIDPFSRGGPTDLDNLTLMCPQHHSDTDDSGIHPHRYHAERDPNSGIVYHTKAATPDNPNPEKRFNHSTFSQQSAAAKIRRQPWPDSAAPPDDDP